jgi:hypothetical protein
MTAQPAKTIHAGVNAVVSRWSYSATPTGSVKIQLCPVPAGAQMTGFTLSVNEYSAGTFTSPFDATLEVGGTVVWQPITSATATTGVLYPNTNGPNKGSIGLGGVLTASGIMNIQLRNLLGSGTAVNTITCVTEYIYEKRG